MAVYGAWAAKRAGAAHVFTMHGSRYYAERWRRRIAMRLAATFSASVVTVSQSLGRDLRRDLWLSADRIVTIPNGARHTAVTQSSLRDELRLAGTDQLAVAVGNLYPVKGHAFLLEALALLAARFPGLHVAIAGRGELEGPLLARARALHVADVFVLPSLSEGVPLALLEAMFAARPIVATAVGEVPTVLDGGRAGVLAPPRDAAALADGIAGVLSDPAQARRLSAAAALRAAQEYTLARMTERYAALYAELLRRGPTTTPLEFARA